MTKILHDKTFPSETAEYRAARNELLKAELELDAKVQKIAEMRRALPDGGLIPEDYLFETFDGAGQETRIHLSDLFAPGKDTLFLYSFMLAPDTQNACPACTSIIDGLSGISQHLKDRLNFAVVAKAPINQFDALAKSRNWSGVKLLSSFDNNYNDDYFAVGANGEQTPAANIFVKRNDGIHHFWGAELLYVDRPGHPRHVDQIWPMWNVFDLTPEGRGTDWFPKLSY